MIGSGTPHSRTAIGPSRLSGGPFGRIAIGLVAVATGLISFRTAQASLGLSYLTESALFGAMGLAAGWGLVAVGLETWRRTRRRRFGFLLAVTGITWFLPEWSDPEIGSAVGFTLGLGLAWLYLAIGGHALLTFVGMSPRERAEQLVVVAGYGVLVVGLGLIPALAFDPQASGCGFCPRNLIAAADSTGFVDGTTRAAAALGVGWTAIVGILIARHLARSGPIARRVRAPIVLPAMVFLGLAGITLGRMALLVVRPTDTTDHLLRIGQAIALVTIAIGVASEWIRARRSRGRVARVVADLAESPPIGGLRDHLATILDDPELILAYPVEGGRSVDVHGRPVDLGTHRGRATTPIVRDGRVVAEIEHAVDVLREPDEVDEVIAAARLGLEHERLQAEARSQLDALRAARRRIVEAGDAHRKQLERDLHDGAQQHLIALSIALRLVERSDGVVALIDDADAELRLALGDLREVAHGIYPTVLGDEGLAAAVDALAESSAVPMTIVDMVEERLDPAVEVAAYHLVAEVIRAGGGPVRVRAMRSDERLTVEVALLQVADDVAEEIADRVGAVDGILTVIRDHSSDQGHATTLIAEIPCAS